MSNDKHQIEDLNNSSENDQIVILKNEIDALNITVNKNYDLYLRAKAEVENIKKRTEKEIDSIVKYSNKKIILDLLPLLDSLEACLNNKDEKNDREGLVIFYKMLLSVLNRYNVEKIDVESNFDFDPLKHEAISTVDSLEYDNKVSEVIQNGYTLFDQVLRYSKVIIFKKK